MGYEIYYYYVVNDKRIDNRDFIKDDSAPEQEFVNYVANNLNKKVFTIKYASSNPKKSFIVKQIEKSKK